MIPYSNMPLFMHFLNVCTLLFVIKDEWNI